MEESVSIHYCNMNTCLLLQTIEERDKLLAEEEARYEKEKERLKERKVCHMCT